MALPEKRRCTSYVPVAEYARKSVLLFRLKAVVLHGVPREGDVRRPYFGHTIQAEYLPLGRGFACGAGIEVDRVLTDI